MNEPDSLNDGFPADFSADEIAIIRAVQPYTMTSLVRLQSLIQAVKYLVRCDVPGDFVECGVWKGGCIMAMALTLLQLGRQDRTLHLFDTFEGMPPPGEQDIDFLGQPAWEIFEQVRYLAPQEEVAAAIYDVGYDPAKIRFIKGQVEETIPLQAPETVALLRLDTDWYESTRHELIHLFPRLQCGGVLIIDDYGHWQGARRATDEYLAQNRIPLLLHRIDYTGRIAVKMWDEL